MGGVACSCNARQDTQLDEQLVVHEKLKDTLSHEVKAEAEQLEQLIVPSPPAVDMEARRDGWLREEKPHTHLQSAIDGQGSLSLVSTDTGDSTQGGSTHSAPVFENEGLPGLSRLLITPSVGKQVLANAADFSQIETDMVIGSFRVASRTEPLQGPEWVAQCLDKEGWRGNISISATIRLKQSIPEMDFFVGGELDQGGNAQQIPIGLATRGACSIIMKIAQAWEPQLHYSFGDASTGERPHFVVPFDPQSAWMKDCLEVTEWPSGKAVPRSEWPKGMQPGFTYIVNHGTKFVDLENWRGPTNIPLIGACPLQKYWGTASLRGIAYARPRGKPGPHIPADTVRLMEAGVSHTTTLAGA